MNDSSTGTTPPSRGKDAVSATDTVFEAILRDIITGVYAPGVRLPAERELARMLGASRPTLREALRRLSEWCLVEPRRGSGIVVRPPGEWSIEVLPAVLRHGQAGRAGEPATADLILDLLVLRRSLMVEIVRIVAGRMPPGGTAPARDAAARAWSARDETGVFLRADLDILRSLVEAARFYPALWLLNRMAGVYMEIARNLAGPVAPPDDYLEVYDRVLSAVESGNGTLAVTLLQGYLERHDQRLAALPGVGG